jgi:hypothetical protein
VLGASGVWVGRVGDEPRRARRRRSPRDRLGGSVLFALRRDAAQLVERAVRAPRVGDEAVGAGERVDFGVSAVRRGRTGRGFPPTAALEFQLRWRVDGWRGARGRRVSRSDTGVPRVVRRVRVLLGRRRLRVFEIVHGLRSFVETHQTEPPARPSGRSVKSCCAGRCAEPLSSRRGLRGKRLRVYRTRKVMMPRTGS